MAVAVGVVTGFGVSPLAAQLDSSTLPLLVVDLGHDAIPDEPKVLTRMRLISDAAGRANRLSDVPTYTGAVAIERRGATSQTVFPKTGYGFELRTDADADTSVALLGMPAEEDWVLNGPYSDKSLLRNALAYSLAAELMPYAPRTRYVDLVLDGDYRGVYLLTEKIKRDRNRVDISKLKATDLAGDSLTGGYILKFDKGPGGSLGSDFQLPAANLAGARPSNYVYHYPRLRDIQPEQAAYIQDWFAEFERRLAGARFDDPVDGYAPLVDLESFVDFFLVNELAKNVDGYRLSTYFYKDRDDVDGRLHMGPVWDFNLAFGNAGYCDANEVENWMVYFQDYCPDDAYYAPFWWPRILASRIFKRALVRRYAELRAPGGALSDDALARRLDSLAAPLTPEVVDRNFARWPVLGEYTWPNPVIVDSHAEAVDDLRQWLRDRTAWMDGAVGEFATDTLAPIPPDRDFRLSPNPGGSAVRAQGLVARDYPLEVTWVDARGVAVSGGQVAGPDGWAGALPRVSGVYVVRVRTAIGRVLRGRWVRG